MSMHHILSTLSADQFYKQTHTKTVISGMMNPKNPDHTHLMALDVCKRLHPDTVIEEERPHKFCKEDDSQLRHPEFDSLPLEMVHRILRFCSISDVISFSLALARPSFLQILTLKPSLWSAAATGIDHLMKTIVHCPTC